jgi:uncharacterized protein YlxW (UPF0749 family)
MKEKLGSSIALMIVVMIFGVILSMQIKSVYVNKNNIADEKSTNELRDQLNSEVVKYSKLEKLKEDQEAKLQELTEKSGNTDVLVKQLTENMRIARFLSGQSDVKGKGLIITLSANEESIGNIKDTDLTTLVNELWLSGAQAISINDQRIVMQSSIRDTGVMTINKINKIYPPYKVSVIGEQDNIIAALTTTKGVLYNFEENFHFKVSVEKRDEVNIFKAKEDGVLFNYDKLTVVDK